MRSIDGVLDLDLGAGRAAVLGERAHSLTLNDIGRVRLALASPLPIDSYREHRATGAFIIVDDADGWTLGAGLAGSDGRSRPDLPAAPPRHIRPLPPRSTARGPS